MQEISRCCISTRLSPFDRRGRHCAVSQLLKGSGCGCNFFATCGSLRWREHAGRLRCRENQKLSRMLMQRMCDYLLIPCDEMMLIRQRRKRDDYDRTRVELEDLTGGTACHGLPPSLLQTRKFALWTWQGVSSMFGFWFCLSQFTMFLDNWSIS